MTRPRLDVPVRMAKKFIEEALSIVQDRQYVYTGKRAERNQEIEDALEDSCALIDSALELISNKGDAR